MFQDISSKKKFSKFKSQGGKIQILLELSYHSHLKKEGKTEASACLIDWPVSPVSATLK